MSSLTQTTARIAPQLAIFMENRPGALADLADLLSEAQVNIIGMSVTDTVDHAVVRLVVDDSRRAVHALEARGALVVETDVLLVESDNRPGNLSRIARQLASKKLNIEYAYLACASSGKRGLLVLRVQHPRQAVRLLNGTTAKNGSVGR